MSNSPDNIDDNDPIINCHVHTFTLDHVPRGFLPLGLTSALRRMPFQRFVSKILRNANPFSNRDRFSRYASFLETGAQSKQEDVFLEVQGFYPDGTRFIVLPMDMAYMGAGDIPVNLDKQHCELIELANKYRDVVLPFFAVDPRRFESPEHLLINVENWLDRKRDDGVPFFKGIKIYPAQGFSPHDPKLMPLYEVCSERGLSIMSHCSRGGVHGRNLEKGEAVRFSDPDEYRELLTSFPSLKLCLAHMGGSNDWEMYFRNPKSRELVDLDASSSKRSEMNWLSKIIQMLESGRFPNLYTDISYTVFEMNKFLPPLAVILRGSQAVRRRTLFGSDYYMSHNEKFDERFLSMKLRHELGEELFNTIARDNPRNYLGLVTPKNVLANP